MLNKELVFIADRVADHKDATLSSRDLEKMANGYFNSVIEALNKISDSVIYYSSPADFVDNISKHSDSVVLSLWSGENSRNRRALVPSICEAYGIPYVGGDSYVQTLCADKHLAKEFCRQYGIITSKDIVVTRKDDLSILKTLNFPVVVKPNFEGGSIGILSRNLVDCYEDSVELCKELFLHFQQLLVEEYVAGEELSVCIAGTRNQIDAFEVIRVVVNGQRYFSHDIYSAEAKKAGMSTVFREIITEQFPHRTRDQLLDLYKGLGKVDMIRIDGRMSEDLFTVIELTPDCNLSPKSGIYLSFQKAGYTYEQMLYRLCENALKYQG